MGSEQDDPYDPQQGMHGWVKAALSDLLGDVLAAYVNITEPLEEGDLKAAARLLAVGDGWIEGWDVKWIRSSRDRTSVRQMTRIRMKSDVIRSVSVRSTEGSVEGRFGQSQPSKLNVTISLSAPLGPWDSTIELPANVAEDYLTVPPASVHALRVADALRGLLAGTRGGPR